MYDPDVGAKPLAETFFLGFIYTKYAFTSFMLYAADVAWICVDNFFCIDMNCVL